VKVEGQKLNKRDAIGISEMESVTITASADADFILLEVPMAA
jgi:hypothetical protein